MLSYTLLNVINKKNNDSLKTLKFKVNYSTTSVSKISFHRMLDIVEPHLYTTRDLEPASVRDLTDYDTSFVNHPGKSIFFHKKFSKKLFNNPVFREEVIDFYEKNKRIPRNQKIPFVYQEGSGKYIAEASGFQSIIIYISVFMFAYTITVHMTFQTLYDQLFYINRLLDSDYEFCFQTIGYLQNDDELVRLQYIVQRSHHALFIKKKFEVGTFIQIVKDWPLHKLNYIKMQQYYYDTNQYDGFYYYDKN